MNGRRKHENSYSYLRELRVLRGQISFGLKQNAALAQVDGYLAKTLMAKKLTTKHTKIHEGKARKTQAVEHKGTKVTKFTQTKA